MIARYQGNTTSAPTKVYGQQFTSARTSAGVYTFTLSSYGAKFVQAICTVDGQTAARHCLPVFSAGVLTVTVVDKDNTATDLATTEYMGITIVFSESSAVQ